MLNPDNFPETYLPRSLEAMDLILERLARRAKQLSNHMLSHVQRMPDAADFQRAFELEMEGKPMGQTEKK